MITVILVGLLLIAAGLFFREGRNAEKWKQLALHGQELAKIAEQERQREQQIRIFAEKEALSYQKKMEELELKLASMPPSDPWMLPLGSSGH